MIMVPTRRKRFVRLPPKHESSIVAQSLGEALLTCFLISEHDLNRNVATASISEKSQDSNLTGQLSKPGYVSDLRLVPLLTG